MAEGGTPARPRTSAPGRVGHSGGSLRLLFAVPFGPRLDLPHGGRVVAQLLLRLAMRHQVAVVYLRRTGAPPIDRQLAARCEFVEELELSDRGAFGPESMRRLRVLAAPLRGIPTQVAVHGDRRLAEACAGVAGRWQPDVVQIETDTIAHWGPVLRDSGLGAIRILTCHEPGAWASEDQARVASGRQRLAHRLDAAGWRRYWSRSLPAFDAVVALTDHDRNVIEAATRGPRVVTIGLGIDLPSEPLSAGGLGDPSVLFVGSFLHPPNADAALRLVRSIMPAVRRRIPGLPLYLVGKDPGRELIEAATADDIVTGRVPSVTPFVDAAALMVLPIRLGGGMRVKLLEGLAAGKAVVTSRLAAAGLNVTDGRELVFADTDEEFADAVVSLVGDAARRRRMGSAAREWALGNLGWDSRVNSYEQLYRSMLASRGPG